MSARTLDPELVSVKETARLLGGLTERYIYELLDRGELAGRYVGRRRFVVYESVKAYVDKLPTYPADRGSS